jgi:hypothetical protein
MKKILLYILSLFYTLGVFAQSLSLSGKLEDNTLFIEYDAEIDFTKEESIASYQYSETFDVNYNLTINNVLVKNIVTEPLSDELASKFVISSLEDSFTPDVHIGLFRKEPFATVSFIPYIKSRNGVERIVSYEIDVTGTPIPVKSGNLKTLNEPSVLASGEWYKVSISVDGVYQLSYSFLNELGVDVENLNPASLNVYGHPGGMLPISNSDYLPGDPQKLSIEFVGDNDADFEEGEYFLFYGESANKWVYNESLGQFEHQNNYYENRAFFYIRSDDFDPKRIISSSSIPDAETYVSDSYDELAFHEVNTVNLIKSGRTFFGETFDADTDQDFLFSSPDIISGEEMVIKTAVAAHKKTSGSSSFTIDPDGASQYTFTVPASTGSYEFARYRVNTSTLVFNGDQDALNIGVSYNKGDPTNIGYLDYLTLQFRRELKYNNSQFILRDSRNVGPGQVVKFSIDGNTNDLKVWDVSDFKTPYSIELGTEGDQRTFKKPHEAINKYVVFKNSQLLSPASLGKELNQDLHGIYGVDMVIVSHPDFISAAQELAAFHEAEDITSVVLTQQKIFNEFSCSKKDPTAIKHFMKMLYDNADSEEDLPRYLLLLGDASYDIRPESTTSLVYTYESVNSWDQINSYLTDDYFGLLDDDESDRPEDLVDIGIGRFTVTNIQQAYDIINKIKYYKKTHTSSADGSVQDFNSTPYGDWRSLVSFVADDEDSNTHMSHAEQLSAKIETTYPVFNIDKIYFDAYQQISTPGGERYPDVNLKIKERVQKGTLILNYIGHGGEVGWAHERVLDVNTIVNWNNLNNMPLFMTATCEFSRFDDPGRVSAGEYCLLNPNGAAIALLSTTRLVFSSSNLFLAKKFYDVVFSDMDNPDYCLGDITMLTKRASSVSSTTNHRNFSLLGDPAVRLVYPQKDVGTSEINGIATIDAVTVIDTLNALSKVTFKGSVDLEGEDPNGYIATLYPTVFGKERDVVTLGNDGNPFSFKIQNNILFKGKSSIVDGDFSFEFVVPKDISFQYGIGKVSYYMVKDNTNTDGFGYSKAFMVGGANLDAPEDLIGPTIEIYLNEESFVSGSVTNESPILLASIFDESGVNTAGSGIGHDITAVIDGEYDKTIVLNDFYEADLDTYTDGSLKYQLDQLEEGLHTLELKAWDVYNNSSVKSIEFEVKPEQELAISNVLNYPNPFTSYTEFWFEHNQALSTLDVSVQVFTVSGKLVKTLNRTMMTDGYRSEPIEWDGLDDYGDRLARGVYVYKLSVRDNSGSSIEIFEKLVILN